MLVKKARVGRDINIKNGCIVGSKCVLDTCETLQDNTIIFGPDNQRRIANEKPQVCFLVSNKLRENLFRKLLFF